MKTSIEDLAGVQAHIVRPSALQKARLREAGFTFIEAMVVMVLLLSLIVVSLASLFGMDQTTRRLSDYNQAMIVVDAEMQDIRGFSYNPPDANFKATTVFLTNSASISLDPTGTSNRISGTTIAEIKPVTGGHLVTITGTFIERGPDLVVKMQSVMNRFSGGQQK